MARKSFNRNTTCESEDFENLLAQVEEEYFHSAEAKRLSKVLPKDCECTKKQETNWEEVDEILKDFVFEDTNPFGKHKNNSWIRRDIVSATTSSQLGKSSDEKKKESEEQKNRKCVSPLLAGSYEPLGYSEPGHERPCDTLKCLRCDFKVICLDNSTWDATTDYLFLRNNVPDFQKLAVKLQKRKGTRAYACQCQHLSISKLTFVAALPAVKWVCGTHNSSNSSQPFPS